MDLLIQLGKASAEAAKITRGLAEAADYRANWRELVAEQYLSRIAQAKNESGAVAEVLLEERDPFVRQLLLYHFGRRTVISASLHYALRSRKTEAAERMGSKIEAMVVANVNRNEIAVMVGCDPQTVLVHEKFYFDVRRYLHHRAWLKDLCYGEGDPAKSKHYATRWRVIAFERGWPGLASILSKNQPRDHSAGKRELDQFELMLLTRCSDFVKMLEMHGVAPSEEELGWFFQFLSMMPGAARLSTLAALDYKKPTTPEEEAKAKGS